MGIILRDKHAPVSKMIYEYHFIRLHFPESELVSISQQFINIGCVMYCVILEVMPPY